MIKILFQKSQFQSQSQSRKAICGGLGPGAPGGPFQIVFWALALALALTFYLSKKFASELRIVEKI